MKEQRTPGIVVGRIFGAPIIVHPSSLLMLAVLAYVFAQATGETTSRALIIGLILALSLSASVLLHELAHAFTARLLRLEVTEVVLTLWGGQTRFSTPPTKPSVNAITAIAGPLMNFAIAGAGAAALAALHPSGIGRLVLLYVVQANLLLGILNALPGIPMDGGRVLESLVWRMTGKQHKGMLVAAWVGRLVAVLVTGYALLIPFAYGGRPGLFDIVVAVIVFSVLWPASSAAIRFAEMVAKREALSVITVMKPAVPVPYDITVADAEAALGDAPYGIVMAADGVPAGRFDAATLAQVPHADKATTSLQAVTTPMPRGATVQAGGTSSDLVVAIREWFGKVDVLVALEGDTPKGIVVISEAVEALK